MSKDNIPSLNNGILKALRMLQGNEVKPTIITHLGSVQMLSADYRYTNRDKGFNLNRGTEWSHAYFFGNFFNPRGSPFPHNIPVPSPFMLAQINIPYKFLNHNLIFPNNLPERLTDCRPIHHVHLVWNPGFTERVPQSGQRLEFQRSLSNDCQVEVRRLRCLSRDTRAEYPHLPVRNVSAQDILNDF